MFKDILKIIRIYIRKYIVWIIILLLAFATLAATSTQRHLKEIQNGVANYDFVLSKELSKDQEINKISDLEEQNKEYDKLSEEKSKYIDSYNEKLSKDKLKDITRRYAVGLYVHQYPLITGSDFYKPSENTNVLVGVNLEKYEKYLTKEELDNKYKFDELYKTGPGSKEYSDKLIEINNIYPPVLSGTNHRALEFAKENLGSSNLKLKTSMYSSEMNILYYILMVFIPLLIFGLEYHTNFGKFIAGLPFKKERVYFAKVILSLAILCVSYIVTGITNVVVVGNSFLGDMYNITNVFEINNKVYILGIGLVLLGAIISSFCGSILSIGAMYIPLLTLYAYPIALVNIISIMVFNNDITTPDTIQNNLVPLIYFFTYVEWKYIAIWLLVMCLVAFLTAKVYKVHNVEDEGKFFTIRKVELLLFIILLFGVVAFSVLVLTKIFTLNGIVSLVVSVTLVPYITWKISRLKLRV